MHKRKINFDTQIQPVIDAVPEHGSLSLADLRVIATSDIAAVETEWRRLEGLAKNSLHQGFDWCRAWVAAHGREIVVVEGHIGDRTAVILPLDIVSENGIRIARFPGDRFNNINTGLFDAELATPDAEELKRFTASLKTALADHADLLLLDHIPLSWRGKQHPLSGLATIENQNQAFQLPLFPNFEATLAQLNAKSRRKKFRSQSRKMELIGGFEHVCPTDTAEQHALLELFFQQKGERLRMFGLPDVFQPAETRDFFRRLVDAPKTGHDSPLMLHAIRMLGEHDGHIAAIAGVSRQGDHVICQFSSIDDTIAAEASPGELLFWLMIEQACHEGASVFDFGIGDQVYKRSWCSQKTVQHDILLPITWKGHLARPLLTGLTRAKTAIKGNPRLYATLQRWRAGKHSAPEAVASDAD